MYCDFSKVLFFLVHAMSAKLFIYPIAIINISFIKFLDPLALMTIAVITTNYILHSINSKHSLHTCPFLCASTAIFMQWYVVVNVKRQDHLHITWIHNCFSPNIFFRFLILSAKTKNSVKRPHPLHIHYVYRNALHKSQTLVWLQ